MLKAVTGDLRVKISPILVIARKEFKDSLRNKWFIVLSIMFFLLILQIPYIVLMFMGFFSYSNIPISTGAYLTSSLSIGSLITLIIGSLSIVGEKEQGTLSYLLSQPVKKIEVIIGKFLGLLLVISLMMICGHGLAILPLIGETGINNIELNFFSYGIISMIGLSAVMLGISLVISLISATRMMAISLALFTWIFFTSIYNIGTLGNMLVMSGETKSFIYFIFLNPIEISKTILYLLINPIMNQDMSVRYMVNYFGMEGSFLPLYSGLIIWFTTAFIFSIVEFYSREY